MGNRNSKKILGDLTKNEVKMLEHTTGRSRTEIEVIYQNFFVITNNNLYSHLILDNIIPTY